MSMKEFNASKIDEAVALLAEWAETKLSSGQEPPWSKDQYERLLEMMKSVKQSRESAISLEDSLQLESHPETDHLQQENIFDLNSFRRHPTRVKVSLPM